MTLKDIINQFKLGRVRAEQENKAFEETGNFEYRFHQDIFDLWNKPVSHNIAYFAGLLSNPKTTYYEILHSLRNKE